MNGSSAADDADGKVVALFAREVPEIASGIVSIRALARIPGVRTKIAVASNDPAVDPIAACVGPHNTRIYRIVGALGGEKVDVLSWSPLPERMIRNALAPMNVVAVTLEPEQRRAVATLGVNPHPVASSYGPDHRALASRLTGWDIEIINDPSAN